MWNCNDRAPTVYAREDVPKDSPEWLRVQQKFSSSLPGAELTGLERVKNPHTWQRFYQNCMNHLEEGDCHMDFTRAGSAVKELWHASGATGILCKSKIGFDIRRAYRPTVWQKMKDVLRVGGHVYGYGAYFAAHALYSHWWNTRVWAPQSAAEQTASGKSQYQLILTHVFTGNCKDYGGGWARTLQMAPEGFHSVCGTESNQQVAVVKHFANFGDRMAKSLLKKGDVYGKQYVVFESYQAYPMYVVTYTCPDDFTPQLTAPRTQVGDFVAEGYVFAEVPHTDNLSILMPTAEAYEMGTQNKVRKKLDTIFTRAHHATLSGLASRKTCGNSRA